MIHDDNKKPPDLYDDGASHVKVTEMTGYVYEADESYGGGAWSGTHHVHYLKTDSYGGLTTRDLLPEAAQPPGGYGGKGPRGRFVVRVEFWPEETHEK